MALIDDVKTAYKAVARADLNDTVAAAVAASITNGTTTLDAYIASLVNQNATTTGAAVAIAAFVTGVTPTSAKLDALKVEADKQVASYTALKVADPRLGAFEAFGKGFAEDAATGFATKYAALSTADFINSVYASVMGELPSAGAFANLSGQIAYFTDIYTKAGLANAALSAKGAVLGQIVGYAFTDPTFAAKASLDNNVAAVLTAAAKGDATVYNKALPNNPNPGNQGVTITLITGAEGVGLTSADPAFKSTANNDTINGPYVVAGKIDAGGGEDTANLTIAANTTVAAGNITNLENLNLNATGAFWLDVGNVTGLKTAAITNATADGAEIRGLAAGVSLSAVDTDTAANTSKSMVFALKDATGLTDTANLTVNGLDTAAKTITLTGFENLNLTATGANSTFTLVDADLKALTVAASKDVTAALGAPAGLESITASGAGKVTLTGIGDAVKTIDGSANTGGVIIADVGDAAKTIKGGSGADTFQDIKATGAVITAGGGNDTIGINGAAASTFSITGGAGADAIDAGASKTTVVYTAASDSTNANFDTVTNFTSGTDKINFAALNLAGDKTAINAFNAVAALADGTDYFQGKAVAYGNFAAGPWFVLADVNNNGKFDINSDLIIQVNNGNGGVVHGDFIFS